MAASRPEESVFESEWRRRFERFAGSYQDDHDVAGWSEAGLTTRLRVFGTIYPRVVTSRPARVLDVGCGPGTYGRWLCERGDTVVGLDYSLPSLKQAVLKDRTGGRSMYTQGAAYHLPFRAAVFDAVVCVGVLQTLTDEGCALQEMTRVLKPHGMLLLDGLNAVGLSPLVHWMRRVRESGWHEVRRYNPGALRGRLLSLGYEKIKLFPVVILPLRGHLLARVVSKVGVVGVLVAHSFFIVARKRLEATNRQAESRSAKGDRVGIA